MGKMRGSYRKEEEELWVDSEGLTGSMTGQYGEDERVEQGGMETFEVEG